MADILDFNSRFQPTIDAVQSGDFDPQGINNRNSFESVLPAISPLPGLPGSQGRTTISSGSSLGGGTVSGAGGTSGVLPGPSSTSSPPSASAGTSAASGIGAGSIADYFARAVLVVLGMIFVAVGLHMFAPSVVPDVRRVGR